MFLNLTSDMYNSEMAICDLVPRPFLLSLMGWGCSLTGCTAVRVTDTRKEINVVSEVHVFIPTGKQEGVNRPVLKGNL